MRYDYYYCYYFQEQFVNIIPINIMGIIIIVTLVTYNPFLWRLKNGKNYESQPGKLDDMRLDITRMKFNKIAIFTVQTSNISVEMNTLTISYSQYISQ